MVEDVAERLDDLPTVREENDARSVDGRGIKIVIDPAEVIDSTPWPKYPRNRYVTERLAVKSTDPFSFSSDHLLFRSIVRATRDCSRNEGIGQREEFRFTPDPQAKK